MNENGKVTDQYNNDPLLNSSIYDVEFSDGTVKEYCANVIAQSLYTIIEDNNTESRSLEAILDHGNSINSKSETRNYIITKSEQKRERKSTTGWRILLRWNDGGEQWVTLRRMKETYPVQIAQYAASRGLLYKSAFYWWAPYALKKRDTVISLIRTIANKATHKYGIQLPRSISEAVFIDRENKDGLWRDSIDLEMNTILPVFGILPSGENLPSGYTKSLRHIIFDVKMDFTWKSWWVKDGHLTKEPVESNFAGVVSRESEWIAFVYVALNALEICATDVKSAYLQAPTSEKRYGVCGEEATLEYRGFYGIIKRALYCGNYAGIDYWKHMRSCINHLRFTPCKADPDVWMRQAKNNRDDHLEYVLLYVDDALCISMNPRAILAYKIWRHWKLKKGSVGPPTIYFGNKVTKVILENNVSAWSFSFSQYVQESV